MTSILKKLNQPTHVVIPSDDMNGLLKDSMALVEQLQLIDKKQLKSYVGKLHTEECISELRDAMRVQLALC